ncbi:MAG: 50S ribosomal protein L3 [Candidatus Aenigmatarchaeota archaeon]
MPKVKRPTRGSMGFYPRKRARRSYPRIKSWPRAKETKPLGFAGYKAGMTHALVVDTNPNSRTKGQALARSVTVIDCPPLSVFGFRAYVHTTAGKRTFTHVLAEKVDKKLARKLRVPKKSTTAMQLKKIDDNTDKIAEITLLCHTNPLFKKKPAVFEVALGGKKDEQLKYAKEMLGKEIKASDIFASGDFMDVSGVTKGKGFAGAVKRFGIRIHGRKAEHLHRKSAPKGQKEPGKVRPTIPQAGQLGYFSRCEPNKRVLKVAKPEEIEIKGGFLRYGKVRGEALVIEGSVPGPTKQLIRMRVPVRPRKTKFPVDVRYISLESKQGA